MTGSVNHAGKRPVKKQFIAGAACPECNAIDKIQRCIEIQLDGSEKMWMQCIACGMQKNLDEEPAASSLTIDEQPVQLHMPNKPDHSEGEN